MTYGKGYYDESGAQNAMAIIAKWMGQSSNLRVLYHDGTAVDADIFNGVIRIPRLACSGGLTEETMQLLRHRVYHEAGHISKTKLDKDDYPSGALFEILNAIEDRRMEKAVEVEYPGATPVFDFGHRYNHQKIVERAAEEGIDAPLWEALVAMSFQSIHLVVATPSVSPRHPTVISSLPPSPTGPAGPCASGPSWRRRRRRPRSRQRCPGRRRRGCRRLP